MAYATIAHVERLDAALTFTATSRPSTDDVEGFLADTAAELDGYLAARDYQVPVPASATAAFELVTRYNAIGANALAQAAAPDSPHADKAQKDWERILKALREGNVELPGAPRDTGVTAVRVRSATDQPPFFTRTMRL